jgi:hypothetical protein
MQPQPQERRPTPRGRSVDKKEAHGWITVDEPGVPYLAKKTELHIDSTYQRTLVSESRVLQIAQSWSWVACGSIICAERAGKIWVIDGQHRVIAAMRRSDIQELPCLVFKSESTEQEAMAFWRANCIRGNVSPFDKLRALLAASDRLAVDVVRLMDEQLYKPTSSDGQRYTVRCISAFMAGMQANRGALIKVWPLIAKLHDGLQIKKRVFDALLYIARFGTDDITDEDWEARVLKRGLHQISDSIDRAQSLFAKGGAKVCAQAALEVINKGVPQARRIRIDEAAEHEDPA